ncbi:hypothetical protein MAR_027144 [Mya arenaria]|uniref:Uncharacterized protein n=1 Tax=Mya arenaria TaxID=6604 RepID=A0ABY7EX13_MYAAR|nr:hypothetical protein MAR_027144 [Mya arenaria]
MVVLRVNSLGMGPCKRSIEDCKRKLKTDFKRRQRRSRQRAAIKKSSSREPSYSAEPDQPFSHNIAETIKVMTDTTPTDNRDERFSEIPSTSNLERLLQHQNELLEQILHQQKMKNDILLYISDNLNCDSASVPQHHTL